MLSDALFCNSSATKAHIAASIPAKRDIRIMYPFVAKPVFTRGFVSPFQSKFLKLVFVGQISPGKGQMEALQAVHRLIKQGLQSQICFVGDSSDESYTKKLKEFIARHKLGRYVIFAGHQQRPLDYVRAADIALVCSRHEAFGRVVVEAMLAGTPVIGANSAGIAGIIEHNVTGLLYRSGDDADLAAKITALSKDSDLAQSIAKQAMKTAAKQYTKDYAHKAFFDLLADKSSSGHALNLSPLLDLKTFYDKTIVESEQQRTAEIHSYKKQTEHVLTELRTTKQQLVERTAAYDAIINSKTWRWANKARRVLRPGKGSQ
jgi:glycosyltransferase involved in cell wall biosynthesis